MPHLARGEIVKLHGGWNGAAVQVPNALLHQLPEKHFHSLDHLDFFAAAYWHSPDAGRVRGMRISVELILSLLAQGESERTILDDYPGLDADDIRACIAYAHAVIAHDSLDAIEVTK